MGIIMPFNGTFPKGEIGINPAFPDLDYKIYQGKTTIEGVTTYIEPEKQLDITLEPKLVDIRNTVMRNKS